MNEQVILVNESDIAIGAMAKLEAHQKGVLHRAFSVFLFNSKGEMLIQQRAFGKYHSSGLWSNTCCSHPFPEEQTNAAAKRRLFEEMGIDAPLYYLYSFIYKVKLDNELTEHEYDHVFWAVCDNKPSANLSEISNWKYIPIRSLLDDIKLKPQAYTEWFKISINTVLDKIPLKSEIGV